MDNNRANNKEPKVIVIGLGHSGCRTINCLSQLDNATWLHTIAFDTSRESLNDCNCQQKILVAEDWHNGQGCGGDIMKGQRALAHERKRIREIISDAALVIVTGGLGGGTATGGMPVFASEAAKLSIPSIFVVTMPFSFEGLQKKNAADKGVAELLPIANIVIPLPNDLLFSTLAADIPAEEAFFKASTEVAATLLGLAEIMRCKSLFAADLPDFKSIVERRKGVCAVGVGKADDKAALDRCHLALEDMLNSPFMGGVKMLKEADAVLLILVGGSDLQLGEMKRMLENAEKFINSEAKLVVGSKIDQSYNGRVQLTAVAMKLMILNRLLPE